MLDSLHEALGEEELVLPPELLAIVDGNRAARVPFFRNYYAEVRKAWARGFRAPPTDPGQARKTLKSASPRRSRVPSWPP